MEHGRVSGINTPWSIGGDAYHAFYAPSHMTESGALHYMSFLRAISSERP